MKVKETVDKYRETFETALELEEDDENCFDLVGLSEALKNSDIQFTDEQFDYLVYTLFQVSKDVRKLRRDMGEPHVGKNNISLSSIKEEKDSKDESNMDKFSPEKETKNQATEELKYSEFDDDEEDEVEKKLEESDDEDYPKSKTERSVKIDESDEQPDDSPEVKPQIEHKPVPQQNPEDHLTEQQMLDIAESAFSRISQEMLKRNLTASTLYKNDIKRVAFQGEEFEALETSAFIDSFKKLQINNFKDIDIK